MLLSYTSTDLPTGYVYGFRIASINSVGRSEFTSSSATTSIASTRPSQILSAPLLTDATPTSLTLTWLQPIKLDGTSGDGGSNLFGYKILVRTGGSGVFEELIKSTNSTRLNTTIAGLVANAIYEFKVSAINTAGVGDASLSSGATHSYVESDVQLLGTETKTTFDTTVKKNKFREAMSETIQVPYSHIHVVQIDNVLGRRRGLVGTAQPHRNHEERIADPAADRRRLATVGILVKVNITGITATDASSANAALQTSVEDGTLLTNVKKEGILATSTAIVGNSTLVQTPPSSATAPPTTPSLIDIAPTYTQVESGQITLAWTEPLDNGGNVITGYKIAAYLDAREVQRISLLTTTVTSGTFRIGFGTTFTSCLAHDVEAATMEQAINGLKVEWNVHVQYNANDMINGGTDQARTWFVTFNVPSKTVFQVDQSTSSGCSSFLPAATTTTNNRLQMVKYVLDVRSDWSATTGVPTVLVTSTGSTLTSQVITGLAASTKHSFVVAGINAVGKKQRSQITIHSTIL